MTRPNLNAVALVPTELDGAIGSTGFDVLRAKPGVEPVWLYYAVQTPAFIHAMSGVVQGALYPAVRPRDIRGFPLTVPPLDEQRRIVANIEEQLSRLEAGVAALKRVQANLKRYRASVLAAACEGALMATDTANWRTVSLSSLTARITSGSRDWSRYYGRGSGTFILAQNVRPGHLDLSTRQQVDPPPDDRDRARSQVEENDLLITIVGANTGDVCRVPAALPEHYVCQSVGLLRLKEPAFAPFVELFLRSAEHGQRQFEAFMYGQGRPHLSFDQLKSVEIRLPQLSVQHEILQEVDSRLSFVEELETQIRAGLARAERLRRSCLSKAFQGQPNALPDR